MDVDDDFEIFGRPSKKRRFFVDNSNDASMFPASPPTLSSDGEAIGSRDASLTAANINHNDTPSTSETTSIITDSEHLPKTSGDNVDDTYYLKPAFDTKLFSTFVGENVTEDVVQQVRLASGDNIERAINMYLDGSWKKNVPIGKSRSGSNTSEGQSGLSSEGAKRVVDSAASRHADNDGAPSTNTSGSNMVDPDVNPESNPITQLKTMPPSRYIGAFGVEGWATKSGTNLVNFGEAIRIERTRIKPPTKIGRGGKVFVAPRHQQRGDVITRFTNSRGDEIGRLPKETAEWVSPLIDQGVCRFEGTCVFAPDRVRVNDNIYLQLRCSLLRTAFEMGAFVNLNNDNRATGLYEEKESLEEKDLRLRQVALIKLFDEIQMHPTSVNETMAKHKKQGILRAAEMAEQYDKSKDSDKKAGGDSLPRADDAEEGEELQEDQLDMLYKKAQSFDFNTPEAVPAETFTMDLRKYQKQALHWMLNKEKHQKSERQSSMHPLWEEYSWPIKDCDGENLPIVQGQDHFYVNPYSGEMGLDFPVQEQNCFGGILADEMGLGKTIEMLSLIHSHRPLSQATDGEHSVNGLARLPQNSASTGPAPNTTLVVAPMSLLAQWESEAIKASVSGSLNTLVYYGQETNVNLQHLCNPSNANAPNLIITSYGVVLSESGQIASRGVDRGSHGGLFSVEYFRVILDEAHTIKNRQSKTAKACYEISAVHRWVLTGTPIVNRLEDLFSLVRFLKVEPWSNFSYWKTFITVPFENKEYIRALNVVQTVLEPLVLRRTKDMKTPTGEALVPLPPRTITIEKIQLPDAEREVYDYVFTRAKRAFNDNVEAGTVLKSYTTIFAQLLRLRQTCCHPILIRNSEIVAEEENAAAAADDTNGLSDDMDLQDLIDRFEASTKNNDLAEAQDSTSTFTTHALRQIQTESSGECPICSEEPMIDPAVTACWHSACRKCLEDYRNHQKAKGEIPRCFNCREPIKSKDLYTIIRHDARSPTSTPNNSNDDDISTSTPTTGPNPRPRISLRRLYPLSPSAFTSAKIAALINELSVLPPNTKSVIFSQFTSFLDLIGPQLIRHHMPYLRFDGTTAQRTRADILRRFTAEDGNVNILLISLRAGGVGLNLTAANHCFMMDPWWSFAVEAQAIDRVHRMGQVREVVVKRFVVEGSIEERMLQVQERKARIAGTLGMQAGGSGSDEDRKKERIEDLKLLFE